MSSFLPILAVLIGVLIARLIKYNANAIKLLLSFSGAFLLAITVFEFIPHVYQDYNKLVGVCTMLGILLQLFLEFLSKGAEHGHIHIDKSETNFPILLFISLCLHSFLEGYPLHGHNHLLWGVVIHKIPIAIIISSFLLYSSLSRIKVFLFLFIFALMTPLGSLTQQYFTGFAKFNIYIEAVVIGILLHVSTTILFESSKNHQFNLSKVLAILVGIVTAYFL
ncbi:ZIP family metal transporter [Mesonia sp. HuA40]|uniref:ZIP family metal transporter n=1 Tax=Mesonia sp. HuA40 TaxID=2602761 RepID=UPI0011CB5199|nr:ZIP family metal transporter [Mesonia sp. HuA40]TXK71040.1 ZIP family metal transporter [Mesonia sp. HuA40]